MHKVKNVNGINVEQLEGTIGQIKLNPEIAKFQFRARNSWLSGTHCQGFVKDFYGGLQQDDSRQQMSFDMDEPPVLCGNSLGANPVEVLLVALSGCLTTTMVAYAAAHDIELKGVESRYEGDIDLRGFLGISPDVPVGYQQIRVVFNIDADISQQQKRELVAMAQKYSPVYNTLAGASAVSVELAG